MKVSALYFFFLLSATNLFGLTPWQIFLNEVKAKAESGDADSQGILSILVRTDAISGSAEDAFSLFNLF